MTFEELKDKLQLSLNRMTKLLGNRPNPEDEHYGYWVHTVEEELRILRQRLDLLEKHLKGSEQ